MTTILAIHNREFTIHRFDLPEDRVLLQGWLKSVNREYYTFYKDRIKRGTEIDVYEVLEVVG